MSRSNRPLSSGLTTNRKACLLAIAMLLLSNLVTAAFLVREKTKNYQQLFLDAYPLIDPNRSLIDQENFIVNLQPLRDDLRGFVDAYTDGSVSLYVEFLNTGANISINPDNYIFPASLIKLHLAMAAMKKVEDGVWRLNNELILTGADKDDKSGSSASPLWENPVGTGFTIEKLLEELLVNSDNTAHNILYRNMHFDDIRAVMEELGLEELFTDGGKMSAKEYSRLFRSLYNASYLNRKDSQAILQWLDESIFDEYLSNPIPKNVPFSHKYGENVDFRVYSDAGIVYIPNRPYLITVMVQGRPEKDWEEDERSAQEFMRVVSRRAYEYFSSY